MQALQSHCKDLIYLKGRTVSTDHMCFLKAPSDGSVESKEATALAPGRDDQGFDWDRIVERRSSGQAGRAEAELMRQDDLDGMWEVRRSDPREVGPSHIHN